MSTTTAEAAPRTLVTAAAMAYAGGAYLASLLVFGYVVLFQAGVLVPRTVDGGGPTSSTAAAVGVDVLLLALFAGQHSVMARPSVKAVLNRRVPRHLERSTYVLATAAVLALLVWQWRPVPAVVWRVDAPAARVAVWLLFALGCVLVLAMTFAIDHLDMFGLRQVARRIRGLAEWSPGFRLPLPHRLVRHPMMVGFLVSFLAVPTMTTGHLLFSLGMCGYVLVAVRLEERDLAAAFPEYAGYAATTPRLLPGPRSVRRSRRGTRS